MTSLTAKEILELLKKGSNTWNEFRRKNWPLKPRFNDLDLSVLDLNGYDLSGAEFYRVNLSKCNLMGVDLNNTYFKNVDLSNSDIRHTSFMGAFLKLTNLENSKFVNVNFTEASFSEVNFQKSRFYSSSFSEVIMSSAENFETIEFQNVTELNLVCPEKGSFVAYKKAHRVDTFGTCIIELEIPKSAKRSSALSRKCRASKAKPIAFYDLEGNKLDIDSAKSIHDSSFVYNLKKMVVVENFDTYRWRECTAGIHFFMTFKEARNY